jgi:hypothetical protein
VDQAAQQRNSAVACQFFAQWEVEKQEKFPEATTQLVE